MTFHKIVKITNKKEKKTTSIDVQSTKTIMFMSNLRKSTDDIVTVTVLYYTHCKKNYYIGKNC